MTDSPTPGGWPPGYTSKSTGLADAGPDIHWQHEHYGVSELPYTSEIAAALAAHAHYRTTREWRLERDLELVLGSNDDLSARSIAVAGELVEAERQLAEVTRERDRERKTEAAMREGLTFHLNAYRDAVRAFLEQRRMSWDVDAPRYGADNVRAVRDGNANIIMMATPRDGENLCEKWRRAAELLRNTETDDPA